MAYCTIDDIMKMIPPVELAELTAESGDLPDEAVVMEAIGKAEAEIDSYLQVRYALPLSSVPAVLKSLGVDLAIYHLYARRSVMPPVRQQQYEAGIAFMKAVAAGQAGLAGMEAQTVDVNGPVRLFSRDNLGDW